MTPILALFQRHRVVALRTRGPPIVYAAVHHTYSLVGYGDPRDPPHDSKGSHDPYPRSLRRAHRRIRADARRRAGEPGRRRAGRFLLLLRREHPPVAVSA